MRLDANAIATREKWLVLFSVSLLVAVPLFLFSPVFLSGKMIYGYDVSAVHNAYRAEIARSLASHQWPLWMPDLLGGMPGIAACNLYFLFPSDLISTLAGWPVATQFGLDAVISVALSGIGMFLFLRRLDRSISGSLLGALFFSLSGSQISQLYGGYYSFVEGIAMLPWAFWAAHKARKEGAWFAWGLCGLAFALQILSISIQLFIYTLPAVAAFVFFLDWDEKDAGGGSLTLKEKLSARAPAFQGLAVALILAFLLSAPQLWLALQYLPLSTRHSWNLAEFLEGSIGLREALTWLVPGSYGWQSPTYHGAMAMCETSEYFGLLPWALAAAAMSALWRSEARVRWMAGLALTAFFFSQGSWTPFYRVLQDLPVLSGLRIWSRTLFLLTFAVCTLAAFGWDALAAGPHRKTALRGTALFAATAMAAAALSLCFAHDRAVADLPALFANTGLKADPARMADLLTDLARNSALTTLVLIPLLMALLWPGTRRLGACAALVLALGFHCADQSQVLRRTVKFIDPQDALAHPHFAAPLPSTAGLEPWRIYDSDVAFPNNNVFLGYENLLGRESLPMRSYAGIKEAMAGRPEEWADMMNERYFFSHTERASSMPGDRVTIFENHRAYPRAWLVGQSVTVTGDAQAYRLLADPAFNPRTEVALTVDPGLKSGAGILVPPEGGVRWLDRSPQTATLDVFTARDALLVLSNAWYPSWRCEVDGQDTPVLKADGGLQAVVLRAGRHQVDFNFDTGLFYDALAACLAGMAALLGLAFMRPSVRRAP